MTNPANNESPQDRITRLESLMVQLGTISQQRSQQADDHANRIDRLEALNLTLGENVQTLNSIAVQHEERMNAHEERMDALNTIAAQHEERMNSLAAAIERFDRLMDYLMRRDGGDRPEETQA
jgi:chromosome segregation ATPase